MKTLQLVQGTPEWHAHRAAHHNASDAPAMLGVSPYKTRAQLVAEVATGIRPEVDAATAQRFADGHRFEALARTLAEEMVGEDLYPSVGVTDDDRYSASFDGLTMLGDTAFEHKTLNATIRASMEAHAPLPDHYRAQMEQQCIVSGAERVLFMASEWGSDGSLIEEFHCWYRPDAALRARIIAGWAQFEKDVAAYQPDAAAAAVAVGRAPDQLPALRVEAQGMVTFSNLAEFRANALTVLGSINRDLKTDDDFADAETTVKWCKGVEDRLESAKSSVLAQMQSVDEVCRTIDSVSAETRKVRLELDRLVKTEKEHRRAEIVRHYIEQVRQHYADINATLGEHALGIPATLTADIGGAIKGRKTLGSITDAADAACASLKIDASQRAERVRQNIAVLDQYKDHAHLFADRVALCATKAPDDLRNLANARVLEHQQREAARLEAERERIRVEEQAKAERAERLRQQAVEEAERQAAQAAALVPPATTPAHTSQNGVAPIRSAGDVYAAIVEPGPADSEAPSIKLGDINARIAPLSITADGLAQLGFKPVGHQRAAKLYAAADLPAILQSMIDVLRGARLEKAA